MCHANAWRFLRLSGYLDGSHKINVVQLSLLETESVMNIKVIRLLYMIHIKTGADSYDAKTFNLRYLESVIENFIAWSIGSSHDVEQ
jgi:hypothetical protein